MAIAKLAGVLQAVVNLPLIHGGNPSEGDIDRACRRQARSTMRRYNKGI